jgi:hypothetical protein
MKRLIAAAAFAALALSACSEPKAMTQADPNLTAAGEIVVRMAVRRGVAEYIGRHGPQTAARVKALVEDLQLVVSGDASTTLDALKAVAYSKIPEEFSPIDQADARDVINLVALAIQDRIGAGELNGAALVKLRDALDWIAQAAALYPPPG